MSQPLTPPPTARAASSVALSRGLLFGLIAACLPLLRFGIGALTVLLNQTDLAQFQQQCHQTSDPLNCDKYSPLANTVVYAAYATCCLAWLFSFGVYFLAGRSAAKKTGQVRPGMIAAMIAAAVGSLTSLIADVTTSILQINAFYVFENRSVSGPYDPYISCLGGLVGVLFGIGASALFGYAGARSVVAVPPRPQPFATSAMPYPVPPSYPPTYMEDRPPNAPPTPPPADPQAPAQI